MQIRIATRADVPTVLNLLADDDLSRERGFGTVPEEVDPAVWAAFEAIDADERNELIVATDDGEVIGTCQLTFIPGLSRGGAERLLIEAVRIRSDQRGRGLGGELIRWTVERARERGCKIVQLTTDKRRTDAHRFYAALGFVASHEGMKLTL
ncbi:GNAT family N-acetyltransferase [Actinoplanes aureus]|jgi:GNAT superfamily N-acetyltransferase|uniref:GNAT family N-acetyltransferase n=1 Tax=Actinoplanes aureus TaxID=2792083 RepID=A0A931FV97_9ACTN|nr:GNAT family N-acetyltransferase [Actinoplanes aureus]MBG0560025.1 GNAT family N-acetyltransferase [Actinoplanes aureus]